MYNPNNLEYLGKHDYDMVSAENFASWGGKSFSVNIFKWVLKSNGKEMKPSKGIVRVSGSPTNRAKVYEVADSVVKLLDADNWDGRKTVVVK